MKKKLFAGALCLSTALATAPALAADSDHEWSDIEVFVLHWSKASNPFFEAVNSGVMDAAEDQGVTVDVQFGEEDPVLTSNKLETAIANGVDAIAVGIADDDAYDDILCQAQEAGIVVVTLNIDDSEGADGICRLAFMGQDFVEAGNALARRMIEEHDIGEGDHVFTPVEAPEGSYAVYRHKGVADALAEVGATTEILRTTNDHGTALTLMTQYLLGHPDTDAVISLGQAPTSQTVAAIREAGLDIPAGGFDISESILMDIGDGTLTAAVDQQPYSQGYFAVTQAALAVKYGLYPSEINTGGAGLVDSTNYQFAQEWAGKVR